MSDAAATNFVYSATSRSLGVALDFLTSLYIAFMCAFLVAFPNGMPGGNAGLALSSSLLIVDMFQYAIRESAEFENQMVSVERVLEYRKLDSEKNIDGTSDKTLMETWPKKGSIHFRNVSLIYPNCPAPILSNIDFLIKGGQKIGIVERTGAGKSSL